MRVLIAVMGAHGHVNPALAIVRQLVARGHAVSVFVPEAFGAAVRAAGATLLPAESGFAASRKQLATPSDHLVDFPTRLVAECRRTLPQLLAAARSWRPELMVYDKMLFAGDYAARALGVPAAILSPTYAEGPGFSVAAARGLSLAASPGFLAETAALADAHAVAPFLPAALFHRAEPLNLVCLPRAFQPAAAAFDSRWEFIGPCLDPPAQAPDAGAADRPLLFLSLGTIFNAWPAFFRHCLQAFGDSRWRVVMAVGGAEPASFGPLPANVALVAHADQLALLGTAGLFVTHGGMNSAMEALYYGVPMIAVPQMPEQEVTAERLAALGLGCHLPKPSVDAETLREASLSLLAAPGLADRLAAMQAETQAAGGAARAVDLLEAYREAPSRPGGSCAR